jgi:lactate dehydrogenase-like 2-hydroxyacid dehydrogenase
MTPTTDRAGRSGGQRPVVLMQVPLNDVVTAACADRFDVIRLWEAPDRDALLDSRGKDVAAIATNGGPVDADLMSRLPNLEIVANFGVGYDSIDATEAARRGVVVTNTAGALDAEVADTAMGLLLMAVRELGQAERYLRSGCWPTGEYPLTALTLSGRRMGVLGLGRIGEAIAARATAFGVDVAYHNRSRKDSAYRYYPTLLEMARDVDVLMVVVPGGAETRHLVDADVLAALGPEGILVNVARGSVVDEQALVEALRAGSIRSAALDVFEHEPRVPQELLDMDHVVLLPHVGSASVPTRNAMGRLCADNLIAWFDTGGPITPVPESEGLVRTR